MKITFDWPDTVPVTEYSPEFIQGMLNRMAQAYFMYGPVAEGYPDKVDAVASSRLRLDRYEETANQEWLFDAANFSMIEFMRPKLQNAHIYPTTERESPGRVWLSDPTDDSIEVSQRANDLGFHEGAGHGRE